MKSKNIIPLFCSLALLACTGLFADDNSSPGSTTPQSDIKIQSWLDLSLDPHNTADETRSLTVSSQAQLTISVYTNPNNQFDASLPAYDPYGTKISYDKTKFKTDYSYKFRVEGDESAGANYDKTLEVLPLVAPSTTETTDVIFTVPYYLSTVATESTPATTTKKYRTITLHVTINS